MSAPTMLDPVAAYAADVRSHLADLPPEVLEDLTGGLEADLGESVADALAGESPTAHDLVARFGTPEAYAVELRESAGLPAVAEAGARTRMADRVALRARRWNQSLEATPAWPPVRDFLVALTPLWWVVRGWALAAVVAIPLTSAAPPRDLLSVLLTIAGVLVSVQVGRGAWVPSGWRRPAWRMLSVLLVPVAIVVLITSAEAIDQNRRDDWEAHRAGEVLGGIPAWRAFEYDATGVMIAGTRATNLFVYGPDGELIEGAQIVDQSGRPLTLADAENPLVAPGAASLYVPRLDEDGRQVLNAFPVPWWQPSDGVDDVDEEEWPTVPTDDGVTIPLPHARTLAPLRPLAAQDADQPGRGPAAADNEPTSTTTD